MGRTKLDKILFGELKMVRSSGVNSTKNTKYIAIPNNVNCSLPNVRNRNNIEIMKYELNPPNFLDKISMFNERKRKPRETKALKSPEPIWSISTGLNKKKNVPKILGAVLLEKRPVRR